MDEGFMSRVAERIEAATEAVSSFSPMADPGQLPAVETIYEWMASHSPGAKHRCVDCKAPLVEGLASICVACGRPLPPRLAVRREHFSFDKSLAKKLFYESVHLEDPQDTSTDTAELQLQEASSSGMETIANGYRKQQSPSTTGFGIETVERNLHGGERGQAIFSDASDNIIPAPPESVSNSLKEAAEEDEEYIWESADADDLGSGAWTRQLARDPKLSIADNSAINSATKILGQTLSTTDEFSFAVASSSADLSVSQPVETDLNNFFSSAANPGNEARGEQAETAGSSSSKEFLGQSVGTHLHDFFQVSPAVAGDQSRDPKVQTPDPFSWEGSTRQTVEVKFDDLNQDALKSTDQLHRQNEQTAVPFPTEESRSYSTEIDLDDFFQVVPNLVDHSRGLNGETSAPHSVEESHSHTIGTDFYDFFEGIPKSVDHSPGLNGETSVSHTIEESNSHTIGTDFDGFFHGVPGSTDLTRGPNVETVIPHTEEESNGQDGEADFDDFLQAAPRSADGFTGSQQETPVPRVAEDFSVQRKEPYFDFFFQPSPPSANQSRGQNAEAAVLHLPEKSSGQNLETDFDFFFQSGPGSVNQSSTQKVDNHFEDLFEVTGKSADKGHGQNVELLFPISVERNYVQKGLTDFHDLFQALPESNKLATPVPPTVEGSRGQDGGVDFDDFFQGAPVPAGPSPSRKKDEAGPNLTIDNFFQSSSNSAKGLGGHSAGTNFDYFFQTPINSEGRGQGEHAQAGPNLTIDNFFQASSNSAKGLDGHSAGTNFDYFFQTPINSEDRGQGEHAQPGVPDVQEESKGQTMEPDFDDFFQAANNPINHPHAQMVKTVAVNTAEESVGQNGGTQFEDFFKAAPRSIGQSNGHDKAEHVDFFQLAPPSANESSGQTVSTGFDGFFAGVPHPADKPLGQSEKNNFGPFSQFSSWSIDKSLDQNGTTDSSDGDFDDFVQAAPQSADKVGAPSQKTEVGPFFQATPRLVDNSQQSLTGDFDDFFGASPQTADKAPDMHRRTGFDFLKASPQSADKSYKKESTDFGDLFQVPSPRNEVPKRPSSPSGLFVLGNGTGQNAHAGASPISILTEGRSSNGETLRQLEGRHSPQSPSRGHLEPQSKMPNDLSDLSFRLADHLVISDDAATNMWSFN